MSSTRAGTLVVGAGHAGLSLVTTLRQLGDTDLIRLVGAEPVEPYDRPPLTKGHLRGELRREHLALHERHWFAEQDVDLVTGDPVVHIARDATGGSAVTGSGRHLDFDRLALATGAHSRRLEAPGAQLAGVHTIRDLADSDALRSRLKPGVTVVVIGGGFIGLEVAESARLLGADVTVVEAADRLLARSVTHALSDFYLRAHTRRGTRILLGETVSGLEGEHGRVRSVALASGARLPADVVVVGVGASPTTDLATALGLDVTDSGIVVDATALTSDGVTVAAGDCTVGPNPYGRGVPGLLRLESVQHATDHARTAAATLLGNPAAYDVVPWFWSDQGDLKLQIAGLTAGTDTVVTRGDPASESFTLLSYRDGLLVAAECVGSPVDYVAVKRGLEKGLTVDPVAAADPATPLKRLLSPVDAGGVGRPGRRTTTGS